MAYRLENLGVVARGDTFLYRYPMIVRDPHTGRQLAALHLSLGGFILIDPVDRSARQIHMPEPIDVGWAIDQAPDGTIYQTAPNHPQLYAWRWEGDALEPVAKIPAEFTWIFSLRVAADGRIYFGGYKPAKVYRHDPADGAVEPFCEGIEAPMCDAAGVLYLVHDHAVQRVSADDGSFSPLAWHAGDPPDAAGRMKLMKNSRGDVVLGYEHHGEPRFARLFQGKAHPVTPPHSGLCRVKLSNNGLDEAVVAGETFHRYAPLVFDDGGRITRVDLHGCTWVDPAGDEHAITFEVKKHPVKIWAVTAGGTFGGGGGKIWCGTVIPLTLASYDTATGESHCYGNPTSTRGEIYNMVWSNQRLYMGSYVHAVLTRYDPALPWRLDFSDDANPRDLGVMKTDEPYLYRPRGCCKDDKGNVYFSAAGSYGCMDSGVTRIDIETENLRRWIFPRSETNAIAYLPPLGQLVAAQVRLDEPGLRFVFLDPESGAILRDEVSIDDGGTIHSWYFDGDRTLYGVHGYRARIIAYDIFEHRIVRQSPELEFGDHAYNALVRGLDGRLWGLTGQGVFAVSESLDDAAMIVKFKQRESAYVFGFARGEDGNMYLPGTTELRRIVPA